MTRPGTLDNYHLGFAPLSETIHLYRGAKGGPASAKVVRTNEFIAALLEWTSEGEKEIEVRGDSGSRYTITVSKETP